MKYRIFISSVQDEFAAERRGLKEYLLKDALLREYVEDVFIFEDAPVERRQPGAVYVSAVECADIFIGLYGCRFGFVFPDGTSPTEREYDAAAKKDIPLWLFYYDKGGMVDGRMARLRRRIDAEHTRREVHSVSVGSQGLNAPTRKTSKKIGVKTGVKIGVKTNKKTGVKKTRRSQLRTSDAIIEMMRVNPLISYVMLAKMLGKAEGTIIWQIAKLRKSNRIRRVGPDKGGHWEVVAA